MSYSADTRQRQALQLAEQIATVRAQLNELEAQFFALVGDGASGQGSTVPVPPAVHYSAPIPEVAAAAGASTATAQVLAVFAHRAGQRTATYAAVQQLPHIDPALIRSTVVRLYRDGKLKRVSRGVYKYVQTASTEETEG